MQSQQVPQFNNKQLLTLVSLARKTLLAYMEDKEPPMVDDDVDEVFGSYSNAVFVNVKYNGKKYGCRGCSSDSLVENLQDAAMWIIKDKDHERFGNYKALTAAQMRIAEISILIIHSEEILAFDSDKAILAQLTKEKHGLTIFLDNPDEISNSNMNATYLPMVWRSIPDEHDFLNDLKKKAVRNGGEEMRDKLRQKDFTMPKIIHAKRYQAIEFSFAPRPPFSKGFWQRREPASWREVPSYSESVYKNYCFCHACTFHKKPYLEEKAKEQTAQTNELMPT